MTLDMIRREEREEGRIEGREEGREEGRMSLLCSLASDGVLAINDAASRAGMSEDDFVAAMKDSRFESK